MAGTVSERRRAPERERDPAMGRLFRAKQAASARITSDEEAVQFRASTTPPAQTGSPAQPPTASTPIAGTPTPEQPRAARPAPSLAPEPAAAEEEPTERLGSTETTSRLLARKRRLRDKQNEQK